MRRCYGRLLQYESTSGPGPNRLRTILKPSRTKNWSESFGYCKYKSFCIFSTNFTQLSQFFPWLENHIPTNASRATITKHKTHSIYRYTHAKHTKWTHNEQKAFPFQLCQRSFFCFVVIITVAGCFCFICTFFPLFLLFSVYVFFFLLRCFVLVSSNAALIIICFLLSVALYYYSAALFDSALHVRLFSTPPFYLLFVIL